MLPLTKIRDLSLRHPPQPGRPAHLSAASGLVRAGNFLYVVADDELHLGVFPAMGDAPGELLRLSPGTLPDDYERRKANKPDLEALTWLPSCAQFPFGALLAIGSGSRPNRQSAFLLPLDEQGAATGTRQMDLGSTFEAIADHIDSLNIEGAVVAGDRLRLLQRGNKRDARNAIVDIDLAAFLAPQSAQPPVRGIASYTLPMISGVPLTFSDGVILPDGTLLFAAIAEDTADNYADGRCVGSAIGVIDPRGELRAIYPIANADVAKIEGIDARVVGATVQLLLVTDADDASVPASLFSTQLSIMMLTGATGR